MNFVSSHSTPYHGAYEKYFRFTFCTVLKYVSSCVLLAYATARLPPQLCLQPGGSATANPGASTWQLTFTRHNTSEHRAKAERSRAAQRNTTATNVRESNLKCFSEGCACRASKRLQRPQLTEFPQRSEN